jgi:hypothetical protein
METIKRLTFKPLTGKRYRCNQTSEVVRHPKDYALSYYKREQNRLNQLRGVTTKTPQSNNHKNSYSPKHASRYSARKKRKLVKTASW